MTLRQMYEILEFFDKDTNMYRKALEQLLSRVEFFEKLIEDGLDLEDEFCLRFVWDGAGEFDENSA